jgi:hypothetical protein
MKKYCKTCGHRCHCLGQGYYISESFCDSCSCNECRCTDAPLVLNKIKKSIKFEMYTICVLIILILGLGLLGCTNKETYPNKMDNIVKGLSQIVK